MWLLVGCGGGVGSDVSCLRCIVGEVATGRYTL